MLGRSLEAPRRSCPAGFALLSLSLALAAPAGADITPPGWKYVRVDAFLDPGPFAPGGVRTPSGGYRFYVQGKIGGTGLEAVGVDGRLVGRLVYGALLFAVPEDQVEMWEAAVPRTGRERDYRFVNPEKLPDIAGLAHAELPPLREMARQADPTARIRTVIAVEAIENGRIRYSVTWRRLDARGNPIWQSIAILAGIAAIGLAGLIITANRRRRAAARQGAAEAEAP